MNWPEMLLLLSFSFSGSCSYFCSVAALQEQRDHHSIGGMYSSSLRGSWKGQRLSVDIHRVVSGSRSGNMYLCECLSSHAQDRMLLISPHHRPLKPLLRTVPSSACFYLVILKGFKTITSAAPFGRSKAGRGWFSHQTSVLNVGVDGGLLSA